MFKIEPDRLYTLGEIFGGRLADLGEKELFLDKVEFEGGDFSLWTEGAYYLKKSDLRDKFRFCIPFHESAYKMVLKPPRVVGGKEICNPELANCTSINFFINPVLEKDLGESFMDETVNTDNLLGRASECRKYPYRLFLKSDKGLYVSERPAAHFRDVSEHSVDFNTWRPIDYCWNGKMYVPLQMDEMESLVIKLESK